ncbi:MAG: hypothetical protein IJO99_04115 [Ruminococcus sp.]|nr:hypothetical protein [Ruminococcus sp.]MBR6791691.1 hypothetical protein [Ruminococcus sp.]
MGEIFICVGLWFILSGVKDIRASKRMPDEEKSLTDNLHELPFNSEKIGEGSAVA